MVEALAAISVAGKWILMVAGGIFVPTLAALGIYAIRNGVTDDPMPRPDSIAYRGAAKLTTVAKRTGFISMESLVNGTVTPAQWAVVVGIEIALVDFFLIFLGLGLMQLADSNGLSLFLPAIAGVWLFRILDAQRRDLKRARRVKHGR